MKRIVLILTLASVFSLCTVATAGPIVNGSVFNESITIEKNEIFIDEKLNNIVKNYNKIKSKIDFSSNDFSSIFDDESNINNPLLSFLFNKLIGKYLINENSNSNFEVINDIINLNNQYETEYNNDILSSSQPSSGFEDWWELYKKCKQRWSLFGTLIIDNYDDWYNWGYNVLSFFSVFIIIIYGLIWLSNGVAAEYLYPFFAVWELYLLYFINTYLISSSLIVREVDIVLHVMNSQSSEGIDDLDITTYSTDVENKVTEGDSTEEELNDFFTYIVEPATYLGDGYYALSARDRETKYKKAPEPPGNYKILIPEQYAEGEIWEAFEHDTEYPIPDAGVYILDVPLNTV
jgi:hypothetical protein